MVSGTPIIDIKPYHHLESVDMTNAKYPDWIKDKDSEEKRVTVIIISINLIKFCRLKFPKMLKTI